MTDKQKPAEAKQVAATQPIEQWRDALGTDKTLFVGLLAATGWAEGYECTQKEYEKAVQDFLKAPMQPKKGR